MSATSFLVLFRASKKVISSSSAELRGSESSENSLAMRGYDEGLGGRRFEPILGWPGDGEEKCAGLMFWQGVRVERGGFARE